MGNPENILPPSYRAENSPLDTVIKKLQNEGREQLDALVKQVTPGEFELPKATMDDLERGAQNEGHGLTQNKKSVATGSSIPPR